MQEGECEDTGFRYLEKTVDDTCLVVLKEKSVAHRVFDKNVGLAVHIHLEIRRNQENYPAEVHAVLGVPSFGVVMMAPRSLPDVVVFLVQTTATDPRLKA